MAEHRQRPQAASVPISANLAHSSSTPTFLIGSTDSNAARLPGVVLTTTSPPCPRQIRFSDSCVLIPECGRKTKIQPPRIVTKDVPIPIALPWRWSPLSPTKTKRLTSESEPAAECSHSPHQVLLRVPYPTFKRSKPSSSDRKNAKPLVPCLVQHCGRTSSSRILIKSNSYSEGTARRPKSRGRPKTPIKSVRSVSVPPGHSRFRVETVPLRPCCEDCFSACELHNSLLGGGSSSASAPRSAQTRASEKAEDWCDGLSFTKGALRLRRKARDEHGSHGASEAANLLGTLVNVDEVDRKRNTPPPTPPQLNVRRCALSKKDFDRIRHALVEEKGTDVSEDDSVTHLFPLPSPKRSPSHSNNNSPTESDTFLPEQLAQSDGQALGKALKEKLRLRELHVFPKFASETRLCTHYRPNLEEITYDPSLPDPDALPKDSPVLLDSPSASPKQDRFGSPKDTTFSYSQRRHAASAVEMQSARHNDRTKPRSGSVSNIVQAGAGLLRGIGLVTSPAARGTTGGACPGMVL